MTAWQTRTSTTVYENAWIRVREDAVTRPDGGEGVYGVVELRHPAVFVVPVTDDDEVVLVEVDRYPTGRRSLEVPAGGSDGEDALVAARRELAEETGLLADTWQDLGEVFSLNGVCDAPGRVLLARGLRAPGDATGQAEEGIVATHRLPWPVVLERVADGTITDNESIAALMRAAIALGRVR
ncbi:NUDIX domain-containing protein [Cellulomonas sp. NPDC058312]|uniref:NUDIX domain-containing protein n=1 Tax=Cellulomonas sp. NPDC058312 TaxID=3346441 RepID=UPI0036E38F7A